MKANITIDHYPNGDAMPILDMEAETDEDRSLLIQLYRKSKRYEIVYARECWKNKKYRYSALSMWLMDETLQKKTHDNWIVKEC